MTEEGASEVRLFVSHHSSTYDTALKVEELLAARGVSCWIAPRDVEPGEPFDKAISRAIVGSAAILLLFCEKSDKSRHVKRELILGDTAARPIIPLRLEAIDPGELAYHLADSQWIDWIDRRETVMDRVANQARQYAAVLPAFDGPLPPTHRLPPDSAAHAGGESDNGRKWLLGAAVAASLVAVAAIAWIIATRSGSSDEAEPAVAQAEDLARESTEAIPPPGEAAGDPADEAPAPTPTPSPTLTANIPTQLAAVPTRATAAPVPRPTVTATLTPSASVPLQRVVDACRGAATDTEYLICADPELGSRAREIGGLIRDVREVLADDPAALSSFNTGQRAWFNRLKASCHDAACVTRAQTGRIAALRTMLAR